MKPIHLSPAHKHTRDAGRLGQHPQCNGSLSESTHSLKHWEDTGEKANAQYVRICGSEAFSSGMVYPKQLVCVCVCACVHACVRASVCVCVQVCISQPGSRLISFQASTLSGHQMSRSVSQSLAPVGRLSRTPIMGHHVCNQGLPGASNNPPLLPPPGGPAVALFPGSAT